MNIKLLQLIATILCGISAGSNFAEGSTSVGLALLLLCVINALFLMGDGK